MPPRVAGRSPAASSWPQTVVVIFSSEIHQVKSEKATPPNMAVSRATNQ